MSLLRPLDPSFPIERQLGIDAGHVVLVNVFTLDRADEPSFLKVWRDDAAFMKRQPGFISTQLHRALGDSPTYLNYAVWSRPRLSKPRSRIRISRRNSRLTRPPPSPPRIFSRRSRRRTSVSLDRPIPINSDLSKKRPPSLRARRINLRSDTRPLDYAESSVTNPVRHLSEILPDLLRVALHDLL